MRPGLRHIESYFVIYEKMSDLTETQQKTHRGLPNLYIHFGTFGTTVIQLQQPASHFLPRPLEKVLMPEPQLCDLALIETEIIESLKNSQKESFKDRDDTLTGPDLA